MLCFDSNYSNKGISKKAIRIEHMLFYILAAAMLVPTCMAAGHVSAYASLFISVFVPFFEGHIFSETNLFSGRNRYISFIFCKISNKNQTK